MASRYSAARPKRAGEHFARTHQQEGGSKRVRFDVRNPSTLAPDAREEDSILEADVISGSSATKRGAVNLDGYDSDSDNETFEAKAVGRKQAPMDLLEQLDRYDPRGESATDAGRNVTDGADDDDDDDMFAADGDEGDAPEAPKVDEGGGVRSRKSVHFLDASLIDGEEDASKSGGHVRLDEQESSDDKDAELAMEEQGLDEEVGAGGLKRNAPKIEAFNLREEMEQGRFDEAGNYVRQAEDPDASHDLWLDGLSKRDMKKAAEAHEKREADARKQRLQEDSVMVADLLKALILQLDKTETPLEALARLGKKQTRNKKAPSWKLKKASKGAEGTPGEGEAAEAAQDPAQAQIKASIDAITDAADKLLSRDYGDVYEQEREMLAREYKRHTGDDWVEPTATVDAESGSLWEFRWTDGRDGGATQGPFDGATMKAWEDAGYFGQGVEFRPAAGDSGDWTPTAAFA